MSELDQLNYPHLNQDVYKATLDNGFQLHILLKPGFKETLAMLRVGCGAIDSDLTVDDKSVKVPCGTAHFLEHQVFENKGKEDYSQLFTKIGADSNAFTNFTGTSYYFSGIDNILSALDLLQDLVNERRFTEESVEEEKPIIQQEIDMYQDDFDYRLYSGILANIFPQTPLAQDVAGDSSSLEAITLPILDEVFKTYYQPNEMTLVVVGDVNPEEVYNRVKERQAMIYSNCKSPVKKELNYSPIISKDILYLPVIQPKLALGYRFPPCQDSILKQSLLLRLYLNVLLGWTSKNYQDWYDSGRIDDSFDTHLEVTSRYQFVLIIMDTKEPISMSTKIRQVFKKDQPITPEQERRFQNLKRELYGEFMLSLDRPEDLANFYLDALQEGESYLDLPDYLEQLTLLEVLEKGQELFRGSEYSEFYIFPQ